MQAAALYRKLEYQMPVTAAKKEATLKQEKGFFDSPGQRRLLGALFLFAVTLTVYNPASRNGFINFDDDRYVTDNLNVRAGLNSHTVAWAFTSTEQANWHPLTWLSHALDCQVFHLNPAGHHLTSIFLHAVDVVLLFLILQWFTGSMSRSLVVAALFAVHPLNVESVAWIAERKNVLCMFFCLLALATYGWYVRKPSTARYLPLALFFAMALMSKPMAITFPFIFLLMDYWPLHRIDFLSRTDSKSDHFAVPHLAWLRSCVEKLPLLALSAASAVVTVFAQRRGGALLVANVHRGWRLRLENVVFSYAAYIKKLIWPAHLTILYPFPRAIASWEVGLAAAILFVVTIAVVRFRNRRYLLVGWLWYLGSMLPMIGLIQVGNQAMADRYFYLPGIGLFIMLVWGVSDFAVAIRPSSAGSTEKFLAAAAVLTVFAFSLVTRAQSRYWHDDFSLWSHALAVTKDNFVAENNYAEALVKQGNTDDAIAHFRAAANIEPGDPVSQINLGIYAQLHGDLKQAAERYKYVLELAVDSQLRASAYANLGTVYFQQNDYEAAIRNFDLAGPWKRFFPISFLDLGLIAERKAKSSEDWDRAADYYRRYVDVAPNDVGYLLLAHSLGRADHAAEANDAHQKAAQLSQNLKQAEQKAEELAGHSF